jgi:hypothetical protein
MSCLKLLRFTNVYQDVILRNHSRCFVDWNFKDRLFGGCYQVVGRFHFANHFNPFKHAQIYPLRYKDVQSFMPIKSPQGLTQIKVILVLGHQDAPIEFANSATRNRRK